MNRSGLVVKRLSEYYKPNIANIMVIHDDIDLEVGRMRVVRGGGAGGHHGVESIMYHLETGGFTRTKLGIGRPRYREPIEDFVLKPPYEDQKEIIEEMLHSARDVIESFILDGVELAMTRFNSPAMREKGIQG